MDRTERILGILRILAAIVGVIAGLFVFYQFFAPRYCLDVDGDAIHDEYDDCYNPECDIIDAHGCPRDSDGDGIADCEDESEIRIIIYYVEYKAKGNGKTDLNGEWVEIHNTSDQDIDMTGWKLCDKNNHVFCFDKFILKAGLSVTIYTGKGNDSASALYWNRGSPVWNDKGDCAYLSDRDGNVVDEYCWS